MNAIDTSLLQREAFYKFLCDYLNTQNFQVFALAGDASARKYYRIIHSNQSYVLMCWEPFQDDESYPFLSILNHFHNSGVFVPSVLAKDPQNGYILLEDLGDLTLERRFWETANQQEILPYYKLALDELIKIHFDASRSSQHCSAFDTAFDHDKLMWELNYAKKHFLEDFLGYKFSSKEEQIYNKNGSFICKHLSEQKRVICHRDYHSRNIMFKLGKIFVIDFQDARMGPAQYDLVSLLKDSYVKLTEQSQKTLLHYYFDSWERKSGERLDNKDFFTTYDYQIIQRCFKACGSFASFYNLREDTRYLKYIKPTVNLVLEHLNKMPALNELNQILKSIILNNKKFKEL